MNRHRSFFVIPAAITALGLPAGYAVAQEQTVASGIEEILVSARRREENVQDVPMSIQALGGEEMEVRGMESVEDVVAATPNVFVSAGPSGAVAANFSMRGIPRAGFFVDGIWQQSNLGLSTRSVLELQSVEVLRGPQGTLYGRDSTGGAIRLTTKGPADTFGIRASATVGNYDRFDVALHADLPVSDTFLTKLSVSHDKRAGFVDSLLIDRSYGDTENTGARADFLWKPSDAFSIRVTGDKNIQKGTQANYTLNIIDPGAPGIDPALGFWVPTHQIYEVAGIPYNAQGYAAGYPGGRVGDWQTMNNYNEGPGIDIDVGSLTARVDWQINDTFSMYSLTNYTGQDSWFYANFDNADIDFFSQGTVAKQQTISQEFQFSGDHGRIKWVAGLYGWQTEQQSRFMRWAYWDFVDGRLNYATQVAPSPYCTSWPGPASGYAPCGLNPPSSDTLTSSRESGAAVFGELTFAFTDTLSGTIGGRYHDQSTWNWNLTRTAGITPRSMVPGRLDGDNYLEHSAKTNPRRYDFEKDTYRLSLTQKFTPDVMAYLSYAQGYNGGGISRVNLNDLAGNAIFYDFEFDPESIDNYELGMRSDWLDGRLRVNATVFFTEWSDIQLQGTVRNPFTGLVLPTFLTQNAASAEAKGVELSFIYAPSQAFRFNLDVGLLDTKYTELDPTASDITLDAKFGQAPELQYAAGGQYTFGMAGGSDLTFRLDYNYTSGYMRSYVPGDQSTTYTGKKWEQDAYGLLNARVVYKPAAGNWEAALFGTNLTDEIYTTGGFMSPLLQIDNGTIGRPLEFGLSMKFSFE